MTKIVLADTSSGYNLSVINANFDTITDAINNKVLSRDNPSGDPNQMLVDLDMNGQNILNLNSLNVHGLTVDGVPITEEFNESITAALAAATQSANSATASAGSAANSLATYNTFLKNFLGAFASDPLAVGIIDGALYYNSTTQELKYLRNAVWISFPQASQVGRQAFVNGTDYTAGTSTTLTLPATSYTKTVLWVMFDGAYVQPNRFTLTSQTLLTFTAAITAGVARVEVAYIAPLASAIVDDLSITTAKLALNAVTGPQIATNAVSTAQIGALQVTTGKLAANAVDTTKLTTDVNSLQRYQGIIKTVNGVADIRALSGNTVGSTYVRTLGYYGPFLPGSAVYQLTTDTTSTDNSGSIIAGADGFRWYIVQNGPMDLYQWGAKGDGVTDDWAAINRAMTFTAPNTTVLANPGQYRTSATIAVHSGKTLQGTSRDSSVSAGGVNFIGDSGVSPVIKTDAVNNTNAVSLKSFTVSRNTGGGVPGSSTIGVQLNATDQQVCEDINIFNHGISLHVNGQLSPFLHRVNTWRCSNYHVSITNCVEARFYQCRFGRNGNADIASNGYVLISGTGVDTVRFDTCQMNQSGATAGSIITFSGYTNPNGIIHIFNTHMENWASAGFVANGGTTNVQRMKIVGCSMNQAGTNLPLISSTSGIFSELIIMGCTIDASATFDQIYKLVLSGNEWTGGALILNAGYGAVTGNVFAIPVTAQGAFTHFAIVGNAVLSGFGFGSATGGFVQSGNV